MIFYTYLWLREDGSPYYVGKGYGDRAYKQANHRFPPPSNSDRIVVQEFPTEQNALVAEQLLIAVYGRKDLGTGCLRNFTDGGQGTTGFSRKPWNLGKKMPVEFCQKIREARRGTRASAETRCKLSLSSNHWTPNPRGCRLSAETRQRMSLAHIGLKPIVTEKSRLKMSMSAKARVRSPHSEETKRRIGEGLRARQKKEYNNEL